MNIIIGTLLLIMAVISFLTPIKKPKIVKTNWHHIAYVFNHGELLLFRDGELIKKSTPESFTIEYFQNENGSARNPEVLMSKKIT